MSNLFSTKIVTFKLKKPGEFFTHENVEDIQNIIDNPRNWKGFRDLISIRPLLITRDTVRVAVVERGNTWHSGFARKLNNLANLNHLCVILTNQRKLFVVI